MLVTAFISLWISNAAATSIMLPIIDGVVKELIKYDTKYHSKSMRERSENSSNYPSNKV